MDMERKHDVFQQARQNDGRYDFLEALPMNMERKDVCAERPMVTRPRVYISSGTPEDIAKQMQHAIDQDGRVDAQGRPMFDVVAMTQSPTGDRLTVIVIYRADGPLL